MTGRAATLRLFVAAAVAAWVVVATVGLPPTAGLLNDHETTGGAISGADDVTATVSNLTVTPAAVPAKGSASVTVSFPLAAPGDVNQSSVTVALKSRPDRTVAPANVTCRDGCRVVVDAATVRRLASGPGDYELVVRGWWTFDREFVAVAPLSVERGATTNDADATTANGTTNPTTSTTSPGTNNTTTTGGSTTTARTNTTTGTNTTTTATNTTSTSTTTSNATTTSTSTSTTSSSTATSTSATITTTSTTTATNTTTSTATTTETTTDGSTANETNVAVAGDSLAALRA